MAIVRRHRNGGFYGLISLMDSIRLWMAIVGAALLAGCGGGAAPGLELTEGATSSQSSSGGYELSAEEQQFNCKKLTGRIQVRLLQLRGVDPAKDKGFGIGEMFGGKSPTERYNRDRSQIDAYNAQLAKLNCATFDVEQELKSEDMRHTPTVKPATKS